MFQITFISSICCLFLSAGSFQSVTPQSDVFAVYAGTSPCGIFARAFLKIPPSGKCDEINWHLVLNQDAGTKNATTFELKRGYNYYINNSTLQPMGSVTIEGSWKLTKGRKSQVNAAVIELRVKHSNEPLRFYIADENIIHLLDKEGNLMVGDSGQSYTLSRVP